MNSIQRLQNWLATDPKARQKVIFWIVAFLIMSLVIGGFYLINQSPSTPVNNTTFSEPIEVTTKNFDDAGSLEKADSEAVLLPNQVLFYTGGQLFFNQESQIRINNQNVSGSPSFTARNVYNSSGNIIINEDFGSTYFQKNLNEFKRFEEGITQVVPYAITDEFGLPFGSGFAFLFKESSGYSLVQASDISLATGLKTLAKIPENPNFNYYETRIINEKLYVFYYQNYSADGNTEIWKFDQNNTLVRIKTISNMQSIQFGTKEIMYTTFTTTPNDLTPYENTLLDFSINQNGEPKTIDLASRIAQNNILGAIFAKRCSIVSSTELYCLVKERKVKSGDFKYKDALVVYNYKTEKVDYPYNGLVFSGENVYVFANTVYIVGQENRILYKFKNN